MKQDLSELDSQIFSAFAGTSERRYVYLCNMRTNMSRWSVNAVEYFGLPGEYMENAGSIWEKHIHPDDRAEYRRQIDDIFSGRADTHSFEYRAKNRQGEYVTCTCTGHVIRGKNGKPDLFAGTIENHGIMDTIDATTNLYNIYEFKKKLSNLQEGTSVAVLMVAINRFSDINDLYGYDKGNEVLKELAYLFLTYARHQGIVYRMDGARFAFLFENQDRHWIERFYGQLRTELKSQELICGKPIAITLSGGALITEEHTDVHTVMTGLSYTLSRSKHEYHGELVFFDNSGQGSGRDNLELLETLRHCVLNGCKGFYLVYQPIIRVADEKISGMEALLRWKGGNYGEVPPGVFIPWLENDACFYELGNWILERALRESKPIVEVMPEFIVNVNVAYPQMERPGFLDALRDILQKEGFPPGNLCIELTERCRTLEQDYLTNQVKRMKEMGIQVALDDFGTGFSSLNVLSYLPVDTLKIDRGFVSDIANKHANQVIVRSVSQCANDLGVKVCMEGIENRQLVDFLRPYGAGTYQGYYFSRPISIEELKEKYITQLSAKEE